MSCRSFYSIPFIRQHTDESCWSACIAMLRDTPICAGPGTARLQGDPSKGRFGAIYMDPANMQKLASSWGLTLHYPTRLPSEQEFALLMFTRGPLMAGGQLYKPGNPGHFVVIYAYDGLLIHVYDPWDDLSGRVPYDVYFSRGLRLRCLLSAR